MFPGETFIYCETNNGCHSTTVKIFSSKNENPMVAQEDKSHPRGTLSITIIFHGSPSIRCWEIFHCHHAHLFWIIHRTYCQMDFFFSAKHFNNMSGATKTLFLKRHADTEIVKCVFRSFEHAALCCHRGRNTDKAVRLDTTIGKKEFKFRRQKQYYVGIFQFIFFRSIIMYKIIRIQVNKVTYNDLWFVVLY